MWPCWFTHAIMSFCGGPQLFFSPLSQHLATRINSSCHHSTNFCLHHPHSNIVHCSVFFAFPEFTFCTLRSLRPPLFHHSYALQFAHFFSPSLYFLLTSQNTCCCLGQLATFCCELGALTFCASSSIVVAYISQSTFTLNPLLFPYSSIHRS